MLISICFLFEINILLTPVKENKKNIPSLNPVKEFKLARPKRKTEGQLYIIIFNLTYTTFETKQPIMLTMSTIL